MTSRINNLAKYSAPFRFRTTTCQPPQTMFRTTPTLGPAAAPCIHEDISQFQDRVPKKVGAMARALVSLIGLRDHYTASHCARVAGYVRQIATQLKLDEEESETIEFAASVHDIGKAGISDDILLKPDKLNAQ